MQGRLLPIIYLLKKMKNRNLAEETAAAFTASQFRHSKHHWGFKSLFRGNHRLLEGASNSLPLKA